MVCLQTWGAEGVLLLWGFAASVAWSCFAERIVARNGLVAVMYTLVVSRLFLLWGTEVTLI